MYVPPIVTSASFSLSFLILQMMASHRTNALLVLASLAELAQELLACCVRCVEQPTEPISRCSHSRTTRRSNDELNIGLILDAARHRLGLGAPRLGLHTTNSLYFNSVWTRSNAISNSPVTSVCFYETKLYCVRTPWGSPQLLFTGLLGRFSRWYSGRGGKITRFHAVRRLRMNGAIALLPNTLSCRAQEQVRILYFLKQSCAFLLSRFLYVLYIKHKE